MSQSLQSPPGKKQYCIKPEYAARTTAYTHDEERDGAYWTPPRIQNATKYQYYVYLFAQSLIRAEQLESVVDVGCGPPVKLAKLVAPYAPQVTAIDQASTRQHVESILPEADFIAANLEDEKQEISQTYDLVICADVIEHLLDPDPCMELLSRCLAPGGYLLLSTPERDVFRGPDNTFCEKAEHVREWNSAELAAYVASHGLIVVEHHLMPQKRLSIVENWLTGMAPFAKNFTRYGGCQMIVAKHADSAAAKSGGQAYRKSA